ncbi:elongation factor Ts [Sneathiella chungangensis]|uniref:Elongation factor Ts n=1 Tax=Sneathiella chungangensis TaxID=1418234 RepID=A0A845MAX5_9PROT|nr:translation elongation factor Ts [Sneathiella chungangensis]MZR20991.1 elongation factor Ts [Sneathiella chungangensis]
MTAITAGLVKELRTRSGAGMMDCKKALTETNGDMDAAIDWLRTKGLATAAKKSGRVAAEGLVAVTASGTSGAVVEVNAETDFVGRNEDFQKLVSGIATVAAEKGADVDVIKASPFPGASVTVEEKLTDAIATIGENMALRRAATITVDKGVVASYVHNAVAEGLGKIGILVGLESEGDTEALATLGKQIAMHVAATSPQSISVADLDPAAVDRERAVLSQQARESGKPEEIIGKMVEGRLSKFYKDVVLLEQTFVVDGENSVKAAIDAVAKQIGKPITVVGMVRFAVGEGIEKEESDFAAEVAAAAR